MSDDKAFAETIRRVHEGSGHEFFEIGPDAEAGDRVEIRLMDPEGQVILARMTFDPTTAHLLAQAIVDCALEVKRENDKGIVPS